MVEDVDVVFVPLLIFIFDEQVPLTKLVDCGNFQI